MVATCDGAAWPVETGAAVTDDEYALGRSHGFTSGYWAAVNDVLNLLNTFEDRLVLKKELFHQVSDLKPAPPKTEENPDA